MTDLRRRWDDERKGRLTTLWSDPSKGVRLIADELSTSAGCIYAMAKKLSLPPRGRATGPRRKKAAGDTSNQRRFAGIVNPPGARIRLPEWHPAARSATTIFPSTVIPASRLERLLKSGENSRKIGRQMTKGRWSGFPLYTLTLEERATCPRTCLEWATCYGNNMHMAQRIVDDGMLTVRLTSELIHLSSVHPDGFIVRLHVLGDFYSVEYVEFWRMALESFPALRIFGFTARQPQDPIGRAVLELMADHYDRVAMRVSGGGYETDCSEVVERPELATGLRCPAETDPDRSCASCGLCMQTNRTISFVQH